MALTESSVRTIETGLCLGFSTLALLEAGCGTDGHCHVAMDPFESSIWRNAGLRAVQDSGLAARFEFFEEESQLVLPFLLRQGREFDLGFVDGNHRFEHTFLDLFYLARLVRPGGLIVVDDTDWPGVRLAVEYFLTNMDCRAVVFDPDTGTWAETHEIVPIIDGSRLTGLRLPAARSEGRWDDFEPFALPLSQVPGRQALKFVTRGLINRAKRVFSPHNGRGVRRSAQEAVDRN